MIIFEIKFLKSKSCFLKYIKVVIFKQSISFKRISIAVWKVVSPKFGALLVLPKQWAWSLFYPPQFFSKRVLLVSPTEFVGLPWVVGALFRQFACFRQNFASPQVVRVTLDFEQLLWLSSTGLSPIWYGVDLKFPADFVAAFSADPFLSSLARVDPLRCLIFSPAVVSSWFLSSFCYDYSL